jgi:sphingomyelin phosphodiesterase
MQLDPFFSFFLFFFFPFFFFFFFVLVLVFFGTNRVLTLSRQKEDSDVCSGVIARETEVLRYILQNLDVGSHTSKLLCINLFGLCKYPKVRPYTVPFPKPKPNKSRPAPSGRPPIKVVHFSDTHVDLSYEVGSNYNCTKPICCRAYTVQDAPGNTSYPCGPYGNAKCDAPLSLEESMFAAIQSLDPAFSIYTGDVVAHDIWLVDQSEVIEDFGATYDRMADLGLVYAAIGNHDTAPVNDLPSNKIPNEYWPGWVYDALNQAWSSLAAHSTIENETVNGSYSAIYSGSYGTDLRVISYNSIFYYVDDFWVYGEPMEYDPDGQLAWLVNELQAAESAGQRVWMITHVPSGTSDHFHDYSHYFDQIIQRYEATIAALFFGHTHMDQFQISYSNYSAQAWDTATAMGYITPSLTPSSGPPAFRVYDVDPVTFGVLDYTIYIANISDPSYQSGPAWKKYYSAREAYGPLVTPPIMPTDNVELTPGFWHNVTVAMKKDPSVFQAYWARQTRGWNVQNCTDSCVNNTICGLRGGDAQYNCYTPIPGFDFTSQPAAATTKEQGSSDFHDRHGRRRHRHPLRYGDRCEGSGLMSLLRGMASHDDDGEDLPRLITQSY